MSRRRRSKGIDNKTMTNGFVNEPAGFKTNTLNLNNTGFKTENSSNIKTYSKKEATKSLVSAKLRMMPRAFLKLKYFLYKGDTEVGGFGVSSGKEGLDLLTIDDFLLLPQTASAASMEFEDEGVNTYLSDMCEKGFQPNQVMRVWIHTHPGNSASPSGTDETTFSEIFTNMDFSVMMIMARGGEVYCRLQVKSYITGFWSITNIPLEVLWDKIKPEDLLDVGLWEQEYTDNVKKQTYYTGNYGGHHGGYDYGHEFDSDDDSYYKRFRTGSGYGFRDKRSSSTIVEGHPFKEDETLENENWIDEYIDPKIFSSELFSKVKNLV